MSFAHFLLYSSLCFDLMCRSGAGASSTSVDPSPGNWLASHRADLTLSKTAVCKFVAKFYGRMPFLSPTQTLMGLCAPPLTPRIISSALPLNQFATTPGNLSVDSRCEAAVTQVATALFLAYM